MPAKSPEAIERKKKRQRELRRSRKPPVLVLQKSDLPIYKISARRMLGKMPAMSEAELREMLTAAVRNT